MIKISNTLTGIKEQLQSAVPGKIALYVCGITPYDFAHVGHGRCYVTFDTLVRFLRAAGYQVTYCRNFTDIDDKLLERAYKEFGDIHRYLELANKYITAFNEDVTKLNCIVPDIEPRVTQTISEIIEFVQRLVDAGKAYVVDGDVYFRIVAFPSYGKLSKRKLEDLQAGARVEVNEKKENPLDFALWKSASEGEFWKSPWGYGRPGWHIECSAMALRHLGPVVDIHGGGMDLIFPHHENEIAQSESLLGHTFAHYWMHNAFVRIDKEKMSKSLGNFFTLRDIFAQFDPMVVRFYFLNHHYRAPLDFSFDDLDVMRKTYQRLCKTLKADTAPLGKAVEYSASAVVKRMQEYVSDDLNTPGMFGVLFDSLRMIEENEHERLAVIAWCKEVLGLTLQPLAEQEVTITPEIEQLMKEREEARKAKDWKRADELRAQLLSLGVPVQDKKI